MTAAKVGSTDPEKEITASSDDTASSTSTKQNVLDDTLAPAAAADDDDDTRKPANPPAGEMGPEDTTAAADAHAPAPPPPPEETRTALQTTVIILALASALFLGALDMTIVTVAVPTISEEFHNTAGYTWIGSAYMLAAASTCPMWGKISDIWGRKPVILIAVAVFWIGSLLAAVSVNMAMLIVARVIQGVGGGGIMILVNVCISDLFSMRKRGELLPHHLPYPVPRNIFFFC
jgi:hypothetical protein